MYVANIVFTIVVVNNKILNIIKNRGRIIAKIRIII